MFQAVTRFFTSYVVAQVLTGVEVGVLAVCIMLGAQTSLPAAMAIVIPMGLPLVALQMALFTWVWGQPAQLS